MRSHILAKSVLILLLCLGISFVSAQVRWMSITQAMEAQKQNPKKIIINFYTDWCQVCKTLDRQTYGNLVVSNYINTHYYPVKFNAESREVVRIYDNTFSKTDHKDKGIHDFAKFMNVNAVPSIVFLDEQAQLITLLQGSLTAKELEPYLSFFAEDMHLKLKSRTEWEAYQKKIKSGIQD